MPSCTRLSESVEDYLRVATSQALRSSRERGLQNEDDLWASGIVPNRLTGNG